MPHDPDWLLHHQPSYIRAWWNPKSLWGYKPKNKRIPAWLDYSLYGPPEVRSSDPYENVWCGLFAVVFGRTEHDTTWNSKNTWQGRMGLRGTPKKGMALRSFNSLVLICMYILFLYVPFHKIYWKGYVPYRQSLAEQQGAAAPAAQAGTSAPLNVDAVCKRRFPWDSCKAPQP